MIPQLSPFIMDRGRPISPLEFRGSFPTLHRGPSPAMPASPKSSNGSHKTLRQVSPKAEPQMSSEEPAVHFHQEQNMHIETEAERKRRFERRGAADMFSSDEQATLRAINHRRTISVETNGPRPIARRQTTLPAELDQVKQTKRRSQVQAVLGSDEAQVLHEAYLLGRGLIRFTGIRQDAR